MDCSALASHRAKPHDTGPYEWIGNGLAAMAVAVFSAAVAGPMEADKAKALRQTSGPLAQCL